MSSHIAAANIANLLKYKAQTDKEKMLMRELFKMADANKDGCLDYQECVRMFRSKGVKISEADIRKLFDKADRNKDGKISPSELVDEEAAVEDVKGKSDVAFRLYDRNKDGSISKQEMMSVPGGKLTKQQVDKCFEANDTNGDGVLSPQEFQEMIRKRSRAGKQ